MSVVYRAYHPGTQRDVAVKVITKMMTHDDEALQRFQREARLIARLEHPHMLPIYDFDSSHTPPYIVMRLLNGGTLQALLQQKPLRLEEIGSLISQVCDALYYAHRQGIVHRDVKPSNILIDREGHAFVADFGVARMGLRADGNRPITSTGAMIGTPDYMAPEQAYGRSDIDHRADIYSLGVVLFELLTGQRPFTADSVMGVVLKHLQEPPPSAVMIAPALPASIDSILFRALAKEPNARYASAVELATAVLTALDLAGAQRSLLLAPAVQTLTTSDAAPPSPTPSEQYKNVTALFINAAEYIEVLDVWPAQPTNSPAQFWRQATEIIAAHGGWPVTQTQDSLLAAWGGDIVREDDGEQATLAALAIQSMAQEQAAGINLLRNRSLPLTIALHTGPALLVADDTSPTVKGSVISVANRLGQRASSGIFLTHDTYNQVRGLFDVSVEPPLSIYQRDTVSDLAVYRVQAAKARSFAFQIQDVEGIITPLIGRQSELERLQKAFLEAVEEREAQFITINGAAGLGKSRLLNEFINWVDLHPQRTRLLPARAAAGMKSRPYALLRHLISVRFDIQDDDAPHEALQKLETGIQQQIGPDDRMAHLFAYLAGFALADAPFMAGLSDDPQQLVLQARQAFCDWIDKLCLIDPVMIAIEDIHHADDASLDLFIELMNQSQERPLFFICSARSELYRHRPAWGSGLPGRLALSLQPLSKRESRRLIDALLQKVTDAPAQLYQLLIEQAEGNPYYLEELIRMLLDEHIIVKDNEKVWRVEASRLDRWQIPTSLTWLMQARLDSLLYPEKAVLKRAAVIGRIFYDTALDFLDANNDTHIDNLPAILRRLRERGFIYEREITAFKESKEYVFASNMMRDILLQLLSPTQKQTYNLAAANWLIQAAADRVGEYGHVIAAYYERAGKLPQAAHYWQQAGHKALQVSAFAEAKTLFEAALALLTPTADDYPQVLLHLGEAYYWLSEYAVARQRLTEALTASQQRNQPLCQVNSLYWLSQVSVREGDYDQARSLLEECLQLAREHDDKILLVQVLFGLGDLQWRQGNFERAQSRCAESLSLARELNASPQILQALNRLGAIAMSQTETETAQRYYEETRSLAQQIGNRIYAASALNNLGEIARANGAPREAQRFYRQALAITKEAQQHTFTALLHTNLATVAIQLNERDEAHEQLCNGLALSAQIGAAPIMLAAIQKAGWWLCKQGKQEQGLALLQLSRWHSTADSENKREAEEILADLGLPAGSDERTADLPADCDGPLTAVATDLLAELTAANPVEDAP